MSTPLVSVGIPVCNTGRYLAECLESVLAQTLGNFEIVAVDDGSRDDSLAVLRALAARDPRIIVHSRENRGLIATRNEVLARARGEFVAWVDSDDRIAPQRLERQIARLRDDAGLVAVGSAWQLIDPDGLPIHRFSFPTPHEDICRHMFDIDNAMCFPTVTMRRAAAERAGGFRHPFRIGEDYDLCLRLAELGRLENLPDALVDYRQHLASTVNARRWEADIYAALAKSLARERREKGSDRLQRGEPVELALGPERPARDNAFDTQLRWAWWALMAGNIKTARKYAARTLKVAPFRRESWRIAFCAARGH